MGLLKAVHFGITKMRTNLTKGLLLFAVFGAANAVRIQQLDTEETRDLLNIEPDPVLVLEE